jgi:hypothetical protein
MAMSRSQSKLSRKTDPIPSRNQINAGTSRPTQKMATSSDVELSPSSLLSYFHSVDPSSRTSLHLRGEAEGR